MPTPSGSVLRAARLTTSRALTSAICSISTRLLAFSVCAAGHQIDDAPAEPQSGRQLHRPRQPDAFGLHAAGGKMAPGDLGVFGRDADMAPARRIVGLGERGGLRHREPAAADLQIDRGVDLGIVEFHQHVAADDAQRRGAEGDEGGDIEAAHPDDLDLRPAGAEAELAALGIVEGGLGADAGARQERHHLRQDPTLGQGQDQRRRGRPWRPRPAARTPGVHGEAAGGLAFGMLRAPDRGPGLAQILQMAGEPLDLQADLRRRRRRRWRRWRPRGGASAARGRRPWPRLPMPRCLTLSTLSKTRAACTRSKAVASWSAKRASPAPRISSPPASPAVLRGAGVPDTLLRRAFPAEAVQHEREALLPREIFHVVQGRPGRPGGWRRSSPDRRRRARAASAASAMARLSPSSARSPPRRRRASRSVAHSRGRDDRRD